MRSSGAGDLRSGRSFSGARGGAVEYVVIGGFAVIAHGVVRATKDLDACPAPDQANLDRLAAVLADLDARQVGSNEFQRRELPFDPTNPEHLARGGNFLVATSLGRLDIMQRVPGVDADHAYPVLAADAVEAEVFGVRLRVSLRQLRAIKQAAGRPQDLRDLEELAAAHRDRPASQERESR